MTCRVLGGTGIMNPRRWCVPLCRRLIPNYLGFSRKLTLELLTLFASQVPIYIESLDVQSINAITSLPDRLPEDFKAVDILVNNAGLALGSNAIHENLLEDVATMVNTNILSVLAFCRTFIPGMVKVRRCIWGCVRAIECTEA